MARYLVSVIGWLAFAAYLVLGAPGCARCDDFTVRGFAPAEVDVLRAAADAWYDASDGRLSVSLDGGSSTIDLVTYDLVHVTADPSDRILGLSRVHWDGTTAIELRSERGTDAWLARLYVVALHELGHHFGCGEFFGKGRVMSIRIEDAATWPTAADLECAK